MRTLNRAEVKRWLEEGAQLVDVLPPEDYQVAHLPGAVNLPLKELAERSSELDAGRPVVVYCAGAL